MTAQFEAKLLDSVRKGSDLLAQSPVAVRLRLRRIDQLHITEERLI
ncbi:MULTISPECIES: hypothetical protein [Sphingomonas]|nr:MULTISPECIES: hypothetical protein [Sphingomonas]